MLKTVWLTDLIVRLLQKKDNILYHAYCLLSRYAQTSYGQIGLYEPDGTISGIIRVSKDSAWTDSFSDTRYPERNELGSDVFLTEARDLCIPLRTENTSVFGFVLFGKSNALPEVFSEPSASEVVRSFCETLYFEAVGSIIASYHETAVSVRGLCVDYHSGKHITRAVDNVSFDICRNEMLVILGASGCGKTSMLNAIGGMLTPSEGSVMWDGTDVAKMNEKQRVAYRRNTVGFVFQRYNLLPNLNVEENIAVSAGMAADPLSIKEVLEMVGLADKMKRYPGELSGGEQQRVCIARALVKKAKLLLCDEPTGALDSKNAENVMRILQGIVKEQHIPLVIITHNPQLSVLADHYLFMSNGKIGNELYQPFPISADHLSLN